MQVKKYIGKFLIEFDEILPKLITIKDMDDEICLSLDDKDFILISQFFWKQWSISRVRRELGKENSVEVEKKINLMADKLKYW